MTKEIIFTLLFMFSFSCFSAENKLQIVTMRSISFDPKVITLKKGETVEWENKSLTEHSATSDDGKSFDTGLIAPEKKSKAIQMNKIGTYLYHCSVHGKTMHAKIKVED